MERMKEREGEIREDNEIESRELRKTNPISATTATARPYLAIA
jgi:hypothetical protein